MAGVEKGSKGRVMSRESEAELERHYRTRYRAALRSGSDDMLADDPEGIDVAYMPKKYKISLSSEFII